MKKIDFMQQVLRLAKKGCGSTHPNPMVGAVVVKSEKVISEGYHHKAGESHAEILALQKAGKNAQGATLYINLEPCTYYGKTPPCVPTIIKSGIKKVHIAMRDPNPRVNGKGIAALRSAGVMVVVGERESEAEALNTVFMTNMKKLRPYVTAKFAMTLDGKIATKTGDSQWISGEASREKVHQIRSEVDAIIVGINTVLRDDPQLTARRTSSKNNQPVRIVLDTTLKTPLSARIVSENLSGITILVTGKSTPRKKKQIYEKNGISVVSLSTAKNGIDLDSLMTWLLEHGIVHVLVEGGGVVIASFFEQRMVDKVIGFIAPKIIGGSHASTPVEGEGVARISQAISLHNMTVAEMGNDVMLVGYPRYIPKQ